MLRQIRSIFFYYKPLLVWSFVVNFLVAVNDYNIYHAILIKLFLIGLLWFILKERQIRKRLRFYKIVGVSNFRLFGTIFLIDCMVTIPFFLLLKCFT